MNIDWKQNIPIIFILCFFYMSGWCDTNEEDIIIGGHSYPASIQTAESFTINKSFESLDGIEQLKKLKRIVISANTIPPKDMSAIGKLTELTELHISGGGREFRVRDIIGAVKLRLLDISNDGIIDLEGIENFPELEEITIYYDIIPINYESLTRLKKLRKLVFYVPEQNTNLQFLINIPTLKNLTLVANSQNNNPAIYIDIDAGFLRNLRNLEEIVFMGFHIKSFNLLSELPELYFINMRESTADNINHSLFHDIAILDYYDH